MKLHEEFKLYENMWDESAETSAIVFVGNERNEDVLLSKVAETNPAHTTVVYSIRDFMRKYESSDKKSVKFYTDAEGNAEIEKVRANTPAIMKNITFNAAINVLTEDTKARHFMIREAVGKTAGEIINRYQDNVADHILELEHEKAFADAEWFEDEWYILENVEVEPDYYQLTMDRPIESIQNAEAILNYAFGPKVFVRVEDVMPDGGVVFEDTENWIYIERWVVE